MSSSIEGGEKMGGLNESMNRSVHYLLLVGSLVSYTILLIGAMFLLGAPSFDSWGSKFLNLAIMVLMAIPVLRVIDVMLQFGSQKRTAFFTISLLVLIILSTSFVFGLW
jgi:uncharacterized membrane protein